MYCSIQSDKNMCFRSQMHIYIFMMDSCQILHTHSFHHHHHRIIIIIMIHLNINTCRYTFPGKLQPLRLMHAYIITVQGLQ